VSERVITRLGHLLPWMRILWPGPRALYTTRRDQASDKGEGKARGLRRLIEPG